MLNNKGQSLLEIIVAMAIFALISATMVVFSTSGFLSLNVGGEQTEAAALAQEGMEAVRSIRDRAWNELIFTTSSVMTSSGQWFFGGENTQAQVGDYLRTITTESVCRDANNVIVDCPASYTDVQTKKITSQIDWPVRNTTNTVKQVSYLTNWDTNFWPQTNWVGGEGQDIWSDNKKYLSDDGNIDVSVPNKLRLKFSPGGSCGKIVWDFNNVYDYVYDQTKTEVVGGFGELKSIGHCSGGPKVCSSFSTQTDCQSKPSCSWVVSYVSSNPNIRNINSYAVNQIGFWSAFVETANKNGGEIYYQLSNNDGASWKYWDGSAWSTSTGAVDYNTADVINVNIPTFPTSTKKMMFKAFLSSGGNEQVQLDQIRIDCTRTNDWDFSVPSNYTYNPSVVVMTSSVAQLNNLGEVSGCSGTPNVCSLFGSLAACSAQAGCNWDVGATHTTVNSDFSTSTTGWTFSKWETQNKVGSSYGTNAGNPGGGFVISVNGQKNANISGYLQQPFAVSATSSVANLSFDWRIPSYNPQNVDSFTIYAFVTSTVGAPIIGQESWLKVVTSTYGVYQAVSNLNVSSLVSVPGTYYIKILVRIVFAGGVGSPGTNVVYLDNVKINWADPNICSGVASSCDIFKYPSTCAAQAGCAWDIGNTTYPTSSPNINPSTSLSLPTSTFSHWAHFSEVAITSGGSVSYQLSDNDGLTWRYWNGFAWATSTKMTDYNTATVIDTNIQAFPTSTGKLSFRAFLNSNGKQLVQLDNIQVQWQELTVSSSYATIGNLVSSAFSLLDPSPVTIISWDQDISACNNCAMKFQIRTASDKGGKPDAWSSWYGNSGPGSYFTNYHGQIISKDLNWNKWAQYRVELSGDGFGTPILNGVKVYYK